MATLKPLFGWRSAIADSMLSPPTRHVALALSLYMNERGGSAFPGADRLAHDTGLHVSTVRERLHELVADGWLMLVSKGGQRGEERHANVYEAVIPDRLPLAVGDPSPGTTRRPRRTDPSPTAHSPLATGEPISSLNSSLISSGDTAAENGGPEPNITQTLVAGFADDYRAVCDGHDPPRAWRAAAGKAVKTAVADGETSNDIAVCLGLIAREGKHPSTLQYVLSDMHANRPRRNLR